MTRFSRPAMTQSHKMESSAFVIFRFEYDILRHLPADHFLQRKPKIVYHLSQRMRTVDDVINELRAKFAIPVKIEMVVHGGCFLLPDLPAKALTHFSNSVRVQLQLAEYTTGRSSNDGELVAPPPSPESNNEEEEQESIEAIDDPAADSGMSESESDMENDGEKKKVAGRACTPGPRKAISFAEKARKVSTPGPRTAITCSEKVLQNLKKGKDLMAHIRTRRNSLSETAVRNLFQSRGMNTSEISGIKSITTSDEAYNGLRRLKRSAQDAYPCDTSTAKRKLSLNVTEDQTDSPAKYAEEDEDVIRNAKGVIRDIENAIQPKLTPSKPERLTLPRPGSILSFQVDRTPGQLTPWSCSGSGGRFQYMKQWSPIKYEDVKPHQIIRLTVKKGDDWKGVKKVVITVVEVQQDCIKGKRATPTITSEKIQEFGRSTIQEIDIFMFNDETLKAMTA